jgi:NAD(P)H-flavin reductase
MLSIIRGVLARPPTDRPPVHFFYGARRPEDAFELTSFADLQPGAAEVEFQIALSVADDIPAAAWPGLRGLIHDVVEREAASLLPEAEVYLAGPPAMTRATHEMLIRRQVPRERIHFDSFY